MNRLAAWTLPALVALPWPGHPAPVRPTAAAPLYRGSVDLTIGSDDDDRDPYVFTTVGGLLLGPQGRIFVAESKINQIRVFGPTGTHLFSFGHDGQGPGDIRNPCCLTFDSRNRLWMTELGNQRYSVFQIGTTTGKFLWSVKMSAQPGWLMGGLAWDEKGRLIDLGQSNGPLGARYLRSFLDSTGKVARRDTLYAPPAESLAPTKVIEQTFKDGGHGSSTYAQPYGAAALHAIGPNGEEAFGLTSAYSVTWKAPSGRIITRIIQKLQGPPVSAREKKVAEEGLVAAAKQHGIERSAIPFGVPERKPPLSRLSFDADGRLWIERSVADGEAPSADIYNRTGTLVGSVTWPKEVRLSSSSAHGWTALGTRSDSLGSMQVVRVQFRAR